MRGSSLVVVTWNVRRCARAAVWRYVSEELGADVVLFQEVGKPPADVEDHVVWQPAARRRGWGSAVFAPTFEIQPLELELTYPGWVQPAIVSLEPDRPLIAISVHAPIIRTYSITTLHRIFSDLTHVIEHSRSPMVLGGDFNAGLQFDARNRYPTHHVLFTRIAAFGLTNCVRRFNPPFAETYRPVRGKASWEIDHLFVSSFADAALRSCRVVQDATTRRISDHNPIVAEFDLAVLPRLRPRMRRGKRSIESLLAEVT